MDYMGTSAVENAEGIEARCRLVDFLRAAFCIALLQAAPYSCQGVTEGKILCHLYVTHTLASPESPSLRM